MRGYHPLVGPIRVGDQMCIPPPNLYPQTQNKNKKKEKSNVVVLREISMLPK